MIVNMQHSDYCAHTGKLTILRFYLLYGLQRRNRLLNCSRLCQNVLSLVLDTNTLKNTHTHNLNTVKCKQFSALVSTQVFISLLICYSPNTMIRHSLHKMSVIVLNHEVKKWPPITVTKYCVQSHWK